MKPSFTLFRYYTLILLLSISASSMAQLKAGDKAPALTITSWIENVPANTSLKGKLLVIDFWATWCAPCLGSVPHFNELAETYKNNPKLRFLSISDEKEAKIRKMLPKVHFASTVVSDTTGKTFDGFGIKTIPFCVLIDDKMNVKWSGTARDLTAAMVQQFAAGKPVTPPVPAAGNTADRAYYDSLKTAYHKVWSDNSIKEYFHMAPLMNTMNGMQTNMISAVSLHEMVAGRPLRNAIARLREVSATQVVLPASMSQTFISYCYKSNEKPALTDLLDRIVQQLDWKVTTKDSLQDVITLEVTDTAKLYADLPDPNATTSKLSSNDDDKIISMSNNTLGSVKGILQERFAAIVVIKNENTFTRRINMTIFADDFTKFTENMASYGIKATRVKEPVTIYYYQ